MFVQRLVTTTFLLLLSCGAHAVYTINILETGGNVVATGSGTINTTGLTITVQPSGCGTGRIQSITLCTGSGGASTSAANALTPPLSNLTDGTSSFGDSATGDPVFLSNHFLTLPTGYVSGAPLSSSATFNGKTFATMGLTPGTRTLTLPNDTIVINIGPVVAPAVAPVPILGAWGLMGLSSLLALAGWWGTRQRRA